MFASGKFGATGPEGRAAISSRCLSLALALGIGLALGACSTMSDMGEATTEGVSKVANAMNPFNWFDDSDEDPATVRAEQQRAAAATAPKSGPKSASRDALAQRAAERDEERYPKLSSVPERPREATSKRARQSREAMREGLVADTENARYTDNELRAQTEALGGTTQPDSARSNERLAGEPPAVPAPTIPVASAPTAPPVPQRQVAAATPRIAPPPVVARAPQSPQTAPSASYGARQAAAASAAPVTPVSPTPVSPGRVAPPVPSPAQAPAPPPQRQAALTQPAPVAQAPAAPRTVLKTVQVATIYFNSGSSRLSGNDRRIVAQVAEAARRTGGMLRIIGHSSMANAGRDAERAAMVNYKMSLDRANAVASELLRQGVPGNQMQVMAEGDRNPIYAESSATGTAGNRRTEIYLDFYERQ